MSRQTSKRLQQITLKPLGFCLYCERTEPDVNLSKEHVVPYALNGCHVLPKASCADCARETSRIELDCARKMFMQLRVKGNYQTRSELPDQLPVLAKLTEDGFTPELVNVPADDHPGMLAMPVLPHPGIVRARRLDEEVEAQWWIKSDFAADKTGKGLFRVDVHPGTLCRVVAKVALAYAASCLDGYSQFEPLVQATILGNGAPFHYVGGGVAHLVANSKVVPKSPYHLEHFRWDIDDVPYLAVHVFLFADIGAPPFTVIVGSLKGEGLRLIPLIGTRCTKLPSVLGLPAGAIREEPVEQAYGSNDVGVRMNQKPSEQYLKAWMAKRGQFYPGPR